MSLAPLFDPHRCKRCGLCTYLCPAGALELPSRSAPRLARSQACRGCRTCELICPDFAVSMAEAPAGASVTPLRWDAPASSVLSSVGGEA